MSKQTPERPSNHAVETVAAVEFGEPQTEALRLSLAIYNAIKATTDAISILIDQKTAILSKVDSASVAAADESDLALFAQLDGPEMKVVNRIDRLITFFKNHINILTEVYGEFVGDSMVSEEEEIWDQPEDEVANQSSAATEKIRATLSNYADVFEVELQHYAERYGDFPEEVVALLPQMSPNVESNDMEQAQ